jgi:hypothetical protein
MKNTTPQQSEKNLDAERIQEPPRQAIDLLGKLGNTIILPPEPQPRPLEPPSLPDPHEDMSIGCQQQIPKPIPRKSSAFITMISLVLGSKLEPPSTPPFQFAFNEKAAVHPLLTKCPKR